MKKTIYRILDNCLTFVFEYGGGISIILFILFCIFPAFRNPWVLFIMLAPIVVMAFFYIIALFFGLGQFVFERYANEYEELIKNGASKSKAFAKTSLKAIIVFIVLFLLLFFVFLSNFIGEPNMVLFIDSLGELFAFV